MKQDKYEKNNKNKIPIPDERPVGYKDAIAGINTPGIELPAFNPPVPNRAWTAMRKGVDTDELSEEEKRNLYYGKDDNF